MTDSSLPFTPAPLWRRIAAMVYDVIAVLALWMPVVFLVLLAFGIEDNITLEQDHVVLNPYYRWAVFSSMVLSAYLFFAWFWTHSGQTIGMQAWKIKVQNPDGSAIGYKQSLVRFLLGGLSLIFFGAGHWYMLFNKRQEAIHDRISHSAVVRVQL